VTGKAECRPRSGPLRLRTHSDTAVKARIRAAPLSVRLLGTPGPVGQQGIQGPVGPVGPPGNLDTGIVLDGGNF
ncbi:hypothetical protein WDZ92_54020, partial [Nostoc sp. NIES-2111]